MLEFFIALVVVILTFIWNSLAVIILSIVILYNIVRFIANIIEYPTEKMLLFSGIVNLIPAILGICFLIWAVL